MVIPILLGVVAAAATLLGGVLTLRLNQGGVTILGLTAGVVLGIAIFDLLPEALALAGGARSSRSVVAWVAVGLGLYMLVVQFLMSARRLPLGSGAHLGPASLTLHSLFDGFGMGLAFQIDRQTGWLVAAAVLTHDLADGVNTVSLCLAAQDRSTSRHWLAVNAAAPLVGVVLGLGITMPARMLASLLAAFAGVFLYIGACELVPRSRTLDPRLRTTVASLTGMALMFVVTDLAK
jgi:ZIP family zinc transporter